MCELFHHNFLYFSHILLYFDILSQVKSVLQIDVINVNEAPQMSADVDLSVSENKAVGSDIAVISIVDPDNEEEVDVSLTSYSKDFVIQDVVPEAMVNILTVISLVVNYNHHAYINFVLNLPKLVNLLMS